MTACAPLGRVSGFRQSRITSIGSGSVPPKASNRGRVHCSAMSDGRTHMRIVTVPQLQDNYGYL